MAEVYEMMMRLGLEGTAMAGLINIGTQLEKLHTKVKDVEKGISAWAVVAGSFGMALGGTLILGGVEKLIKRTAAYSDELAKLRNISKEMADAVDSGAVQNQAFELSKATNLKVPDLMKILGVATPIFGLEEAKQIWQPLADYAWAQQNQSGFKGEAGADLMKAIRSGELMGRFTNPTTGAIDLPKVKEFLDMLNQIIAASHGTVNAESLLGLAKTGGVYTRGLSGLGLIHEAVLAQAMGGPRAGTAYMSLWQQMAGGTMFNRTAEGMQQMGLLKEGEWHSKGGRVIIDDEASKRLTGLISQDPMILAQIYKQHFAEQSRQQVEAGGQPISPEDQMRMVMRSMNRQTTQRMTSEMVANYDQMMREGERWLQGAGVDQANKNWMDKSVTANMQALTNAWDSLLMAVGGPQNENIIKFLHTLTGFVQGMTDSIRGMDPETLKKIEIGVAGLGVALVALGVAGVIAGAVALAPGGAVAVGVASLAAMLAMFTDKDWLQSTSIMDAITAGLAKMWDWLKQIASLFSTINNLPMMGGKAIPNGGSAWPEWGGRDHEGGMSPKKSSFLDQLGQTKQVLQPIQIDFKLDGRSMGQAMGDIIQDISNHPTSASASNGWNAYRSSGGGRQDT